MIKMAISKLEKKNELCFEIFFKHRSNKGYYHGLNEKAGRGGTCLRAFKRKAGLGCESSLSGKFNSRKSSNSLLSHSALLLA